MPQHTYTHTCVSARTPHELVALDYARTMRGTTSCSSIVMAYIAMAYTAMACIVMAYIAMAYIAMAYIAMAEIAMAYIGMAYIVMAPCYARSL